MSDDVSIDEDEGGCTKADRAGQERTQKGGLEIPGEVIGTWMVLLGAELPIASSVSGRKGACACVCGRDHCWKISLYSTRGPVVRYENMGRYGIVHPPIFQCADAGVLTHRRQRSESQRISKIVNELIRMPDVVW